MTFKGHLFVAFLWVVSILFAVWAKGEREIPRLYFETTDPILATELLAPLSEWKLIYDLPPGSLPRVFIPVIEIRNGVKTSYPGEIHLHCPEELNGGGYRKGQFIRLVDRKK